MLSIYNKCKKKLSLFKVRMILASLLLVTVILHFFIPVYEGQLPLPSFKDNNAYISELSRHIYWRNPVWTLVTGDSETSKNQSDLQIFEDGVPLGPAHSQHSVIRHNGAGTYSHWGGALFFSSSDNTDPRTNGRSYTIKVKAGLRWWITVLSIVAGSCLVLSYIFLLNKNSVIRVCILNYTIFICLMIVVFFIGELYIRAVKGIKPSSTSIETLSNIGNIYVPTSDIFWTNFTDFAVSEHVNSIGFVDREPPKSEKQPNEIRIAFIGDSFVEALQVKTSQKSHVVLENLLNNKDGKNRFTTAAYGYSGTGQANQLPYYDFFAKQIKPDFVVLIIVSNDFSDNCPVHVALRNGWHPEHNPRTTVQKNSAGNFYIAPPQMDYSEFLLPVAATFSYNSFFSKLRVVLFKYSMLYRYISTSLQLKYKLNIGVFSGEYTNNNVANERLKFLQEQNEHSELVNQENDINIANLESLFSIKDISPLSLDGLARTDFAISEWKRRADEDNFQLIALLSHSASMYCKKDSLMRERFAGILDKYNIKHFDQCNTILGAGHMPMEANYSHDGHWNPQGHIWAAETLAPYFENIARTRDDKQSLR